MGHYKSNLRDLEFNLFEVFGAQERYGVGPFAEMDQDTARNVLVEVERLAAGELADSFADADRTPPVFDPRTGSACLPEGFKKSYKAFLDSEWWRLGLAEGLGGEPCPPSLFWSMGELVLGANPALWMYTGFPSFASVIFRLGTEEQRKIARRMVDGRWGATMVLTEPDAGSDVGAARTTARRQDDGSWHLEGVKRFITGGEHDLAENIVHFVLARPEGAGAGTKGLSLFLVPKFTFDWDTGELGERNGVYATNVERKMGLKASTTCELTFGADRPAKGWQLGERHDGIRQMFTIIEFARMLVGTKAIATLSTGYLNALDYAKSRVQGPDLAAFADKDSPRVAITRHPDVRRSLLGQKAYAEGMRALMLHTATVQDRIAEAEHRGEPADRLRSMNDLLLPIVKGYGSEKSYDQLTECLQTLGGSGYLQDYPIEQYIRDAKIDSLYEGTTAIQGMDFFFRKIVKDSGRAFTALVEEIRAFVGREPGGTETEAARELLTAALDGLEGMLGAMLGQLAEAQSEPRNMHRVGQHTTRLLFAAGDVVVAYLLQRQAEVALRKLPTASARDQAFYRGKVAAARFFAREVLPLVPPQRTIVEQADLSLMELPEDAF
ncbi:acyl-CoA dehydrogenase [Streptomyces sp. RB110-1]|uniref:acyl-CoA dehydrogenase n=1 Tax=unclassified Streptomyces TaxID=2593676 RepID=UPI0019017506|nr:MULTISPECIES: acyl-CoA dehydrogenase [unclassified Streptomyces]MBK0373325.1 acyl-CoA dehydrogenase [Streptomyces sp. RB110-1]MBK0390307.1 acyl-CoA dehydrogenase [Streptomyces sp. RB110-2]